MISLCGEPGPEVNLVIISCALTPYHGLLATEGNKEAGSVNQLSITSLEHL